MKCFNAREGIFAFRTQPFRHFLHARVNPVSMPARAFLLFGLVDTLPSLAEYHKFQCPRGHFCFSDVAEQGEGSPRPSVSMPARAFLLFGQAVRLTDWERDFVVSMPARAFLLFGHLRLHHRRGMAVCFNAREGIFAFRTVLFFPGIHFRAYCFNAREGIFAFRTRS